MLLALLGMGALAAFGVSAAVGAVSDAKNNPEEFRANVDRRIENYKELKEKKREEYENRNSK